jgi:hypothetical protein
MFGISQYTGSRPDRVDVQLDLEGEKRKAAVGASAPAESKPEEKAAEEKKDDEGEEDAE